MPYLDMAGTTKLSTDIQGALSSIFILYDPAGFQQTTGTCATLTQPAPVPTQTVTGGTWSTAGPTARC